MKGPENTFTIHLQQFEGPFDLLLFFIQRDEIDIYDIPIHQITEDFLAYLQRLEEMDIDVASEFILMAATLMRIKARMLLPRRELDEAGNEIDPRRDLVQQLIEYKKFKDILGEMRNLEETRARKYSRLYASEELKFIAERSLVDMEMESVTLFKLMKAFESVLVRYEKRQVKRVHTVIRYNYTVEEQKTFILGRLKKRKKTGFTHLFDVIQDRIEAIVTFLALLELLSASQIQITLGDGLNNFWVETSPQEG